MTVTWKLASGRQVQLIKYFGCVVNSHIPSQDREKFDKKEEKNIFLGYDNESKGYRLFNPKTNKLVNSHVNKIQKDWQNTVSGFFFFFNSKKNANPSTQEVYKRNKVQNYKLLIFHISKATDCTLKRNKRVHPLPVTINLLICIKYNLIAKYQIRRYIMALTNITHLFSNGEGAS